MMASHIIGDSDDESGNDNDLLDRSIEPQSIALNAGQSTEEGPSDARQHDSLHDSTDSTG